MPGISTFRSDDSRDAYFKLYDAALDRSAIPITESDVDTSFGRTHVLHAGDPLMPPLVALHGAAISSTSWIPLLPTLAANHSVTMIDTIGEPGKSIPTMPTTNSADVVAWLDETLRGVGIERSAIVAMSRGAWIATHYAMAFPARVDRLAFVCPVGIVGGISPSFLLRALSMAFSPTQRRVESFLDTMVLPKNRVTLRQGSWGPIIEQFVCGAVGFKVALSNPQPKLWPMRADCDLQRLASARIPVLAIIGRDESAHNGPKTATRFRQQLPEARIELVAAANHMVMVDQPEIVEKVLAEFLQQG